MRWQPMKPPGLPSLARPEHKLPKLRKAPPNAYLAEGGPFNGQVLTLSDGCTGPLVVGADRGRYLVGTCARYRRYAYAVQYVKTWGVKQARHNLNMGTSVWRPSP